MRQRETLAYLAGAMDSDGSFGIKRSTYHRRVRGDATNAVYSERIALGQVTPQIPSLLKKTFGGSFRLAKGQTPNSKPMYRYNATDRNAANACKALLPYLQVKRPQAEILLNLRKSKEGAMWQAAYWFVREYPHWHNMELATTKEAAQILGHKSHLTIAQSIRNGTLVALPYDYSGKDKPRIPLALIERVAANVGRDGRARNQAPELVALRESYYQQVKELNMIGVNGTPVYHRTGCYTPLD